MKRKILKAQSGDLESYRHIVEEYSMSVRAYIAGRLHDHQHIDDLVQEVFVSAWKSLKRYKSTGCFKSWLMAIAHHKLTDYLRSHYRKEKLRSSFEQEVQRLLTISEPVAGGVVERLRQCLESLPLEAKGLIKARYFEGQEVNRLAKNQQSSENAVSSRLFRIRRKLRECIEGK